MISLVILVIVFVTLAPQVYFGISAVGKLHYRTGITIVQALRLYKHSGARRKRTRHGIVVPAGGPAGVGAGSMSKCARPSRRAQVASIVQ